MKKYVVLGLLLSILPVNTINATEIEGVEYGDPIRLKTDDLDFGTLYVEDGRSGCGAPHHIRLHTQDPAQIEGFIDGFAPYIAERYIETLCPQNTSLKLIIANINGRVRTTYLVHEDDNWSPTPPAPPPQLPPITSDDPPPSAPADPPSSAVAATPEVPSEPKGLPNQTKEPPTTASVQPITPPSPAVSDTPPPANSIPPDEQPSDIGTRQTLDIRSREQVIVELPPVKDIPVQDFLSVAWFAAKDTNFARLQTIAIAEGQLPLRPLTSDAIERLRPFIQRVNEDDNDFIAQAITDLTALAVLVTDSRTKGRLESALLLTYLTNPTVWPSETADVSTAIQAALVSFRKRYIGKHCSVNFVGLGITESDLQRQVRTRAGDMDLAELLCLLKIERKQQPIIEKSGWLTTSFQLTFRNREIISLTPQDGVLQVLPQPLARASSQIQAFGDGL